MSEKKKIVGDEKNKFENQLEEILEINRDILKSVKYIKKYYFWQRIFNNLKWIILVIAIIIGAISLQSVVNYAKNYTDSFANQLNGVEEQANF
ncbi:MAG: hypothetical protein WC146_00210 [Patescibacteria group bacterium]|jgi:hypothetical protein